MNSIAVIMFIDTFQSDYTSVVTLHYNYNDSSCAQTLITYLLSFSIIEKLKRIYMYTSIWVYFLIRKQK